MTGYIGDIEKATSLNSYFRQVLFTAKHSQLVVMCLQAGEEIGVETHDAVDQFLRIESGSGKSILNGEESEVSAGYAVVVPAGTTHNIINTGQTQLKLYSVYSPPNHPEGTVHKTREEALAAEAQHK